MSSGTNQSAPLCASIRMLGNTGREGFGTGCTAAGERARMEWCPPLLPGGWCRLTISDFKTCSHGSFLGISPNSQNSSSPFIGNRDLNSLSKCIISFCQLIQTQNQPSTPPHMFAKPHTAFLRSKNEMGRIYFILF